MTLAPSNTDILLYRGNAWSALQQYQRSLDDYSEGIKKDPRRADLWIARGAIYSDKLGEYNRAISDFRQASSLDPNDGNASIDIAIASYKDQRYDTSLVWCDKAIAHGKPIGYLVKSLSYYRKHDFPSAAREARLAKDAGISVPDSLVRIRQ